MSPRAHSARAPANTEPKNSHAKRRTFSRTDSGPAGSVGASLPPIIHQPWTAVSTKKTAISRARRRAVTASIAPASRINQTITAPVSKALPLIAAPTPNTCMVA
jgi:hypothetical protein